MSSFEEFAGYIHRNPTLSPDQVTQLLTMFQGLNPPIQNATDFELDVLADQVRYRSTTQVVATSPNYPQNRERKTGMYQRRPPKEVTAFNSVFALNGAMSYAFPVHELINAFPQLFGCLGFATGSQYQTITDDTRLAVDSGKTGVAFMVINPSGTGGIICKRDIANTTNAGMEIWISGGTTINVRIADGTHTTLLSVTYASLADGNPHKVICNIPDSGNLEIFVDGASQGTIDRGSVGSITNSRTCYTLCRDNAGTPQAKYNGQIALLFWKKGEIFSSQQRTDYGNGVIDTSTSSTTDIFSIPYNYDGIQPDCTVALCMCMVTYYFYLLNDGASHFLLNDGTSRILMDSLSG